MARHWHIEHRNGREWTRQELDAYVERSRARDWIYTDARFDAAVLDTTGHLYLLDRDRRWHPPGPDMVVVFDRGAE